MRRYHSTGDGWTKPARMPEAWRRNIYGPIQPLEPKRWWQLRKAK